MRQGRNCALAGRVAWLATLTLVGCTSVDSAADRQIAEQRLPRPAVIVVHDFAVSPDEVEAGRPWSSARLVQDTARTAGEKAVGHAFADAFAGALVGEIQKLGLPAQRAAAANLPSGNAVTIEGRFISLAGDPSEPGIVGFAGGYPDIVADVQIYDASSRGERLSDDIEVSLTEADKDLPAALLPDPTITAGQIATGAATPSSARAAQLQAAARQAAATVAAQLEPLFVDRGWIPPSQS